MNKKNQAIYENPFTICYLAEQFVRETENIINKGLLSPEMFNVPELVSLITEPMNHFLLGVPGAGKTMILASLRVECLSLINTEDHLKKEFLKIWAYIANGLWGIYHGLLINNEFLRPENFRGFGLDDSRWVKIFGDFINASYLKQMLEHLFLSINAPEHPIPIWLGFSTKQDNIKSAIKSFAMELGMPVEGQTIGGLLNWTKERLALYEKIIKHRVNPIMKESELPTSHFFGELGYIPIKFIDKLRQFGVMEQNQKVFFMLDEYDSCELANRLKFAYAINSFVKASARGAVPNLFVKVGSRPHGFYDKSVLDGHAKIEEGRDYRGINLMVILRKNHKVFSNLIADIANRRIKNIVWFKNKGLVEIKELLQNISPLDEGDLYRADKAEQDAHFKILESYKGLFSGSGQVFEELITLIKHRVSRPLYQKYLTIEACRELQKLKNKNLKGKRVAKFNQEYKILVDKLNSIAAFINAGAKLKLNSKIYYKIKDMKEPALFLLASDFREQKRYCGFETIRLMSEGIPLNFIKLGKAIFDELRYRTSEFEKSLKIDIKWQNRAMRKLAEETRKGAVSYLSNGPGFLVLLDELGFIFRKVQLSPTATYPSINGFSIEVEPEWLVNIDLSPCANGIDKNQLKYLKDVLREAIDWGYIIEETHRSKEGSLKTRTKYYINSILSPYYDLSIRHRKEPYYFKINDLIKLTSMDSNGRAYARKEIMAKTKALNNGRPQVKQRYYQMSVNDSLE